MANKDITIKDATDKELNELVIRLRKENEVQNMIRDIKLKSLPRQNGYDYVLDEEGISTETPIKDLYHFGILGMKWGQRKASSESGEPRGSKKDFSEDHVFSRNLKSKKVAKLSNKDLQTLNKRLQLEQSLRNLKSSDYQKGFEIVKTITAIGTTLASAYAFAQTPFARELAEVIGL